MPIRDVFKTPVQDGEVYWITQITKGRYKLQYNKNPKITTYKYRIIKINKFLKNTIQATGYSKEEILEHWETITGHKDTL